MSLIKKSTDRFRGDSLTRDQGNTDLRYVDIKDESEREWLGKMIQSDIWNGEEELVTSGMHDQWDLNNLYYESMQLPLGMSNDYAAEFVRSNAYTNSGRFDTRRFRLKPNDQNTIYVIDNKIGDVIDGKDSEFADAHRDFIVKNDDIQRNNALEKATQRYFTKVQNRNQVWQQFHYPAIQMKHRLGLAWTNVDYDEQLKDGDLNWRLMHPRDVILDTLPELKYFLDARFIIPKMRVPLFEAKQYLAQFGVDPDDVKADEDYFHTNEPLRARYKTQHADKDRTQFVTLYFPEYRKVYIDNNPAGGDWQGATGLEGAELQDAMDEAKKGKKQVYYFNGIYNKQLGVVHWSISRFFDPYNLMDWQFRFFPWYEKMSGVRLYPISLVEKLLNIQDIINISETIILDNARNSNRLRGILRGKMKEKHGQQFEDFIKYGGFIDDIGGDESQPINQEIDFVKFPGLAEEHYKFFELMENSMNRQGPKGQQIQGKVIEPRDAYLSGVARQELRRDISTSMQPDQLNVNWSATQEMRRVYRILAETKKGPDWTEIKDELNETTNISPINVTATAAEFEEFIMEQYPDKALPDAIEEFEKENYVEYSWKRRDLLTGRQFNDEEIRTKTSTCRINHLYRNDGTARSFDIRIEFDFGFKQNEEQDKQMLAGIVEKNPNNLPLLKRLLKRMGGGMSNEADGIIKDIKEGNMAIQVGSEAVQRGPAFLQLLQKLAQDYDAQQQMVNEASKKGIQPGGAGGGVPSTVTADQLQAA